MNQHLIRTIQMNKDKIKDGRFIDAYNRTIREDNLSGCIYAGVSSKNQIFVIVRKGDKDG